jgi:HAD superfamily hydrolase (TIGR01509 family)
MTVLKAVFFDMDGVIVDTERDGHRVAFNHAFKDFGIPVEWSVEEYHKLLQVGGGKERMRYFLHSEGFGTEVKAEDEQDLIAALHQRKTALFIDLIESGKIPLRPGVKRFMKEAMQAGLMIGIATTSNEKAARAIVDHLLKEIQFDFILAGDIVNKKKPDPEIYLLALQKASADPDECVVIEDSRNGVLAAKSAGIRVIATTNGYTQNEDLNPADLIVTCLGDPDGEKGELKIPSERLKYDGVLRVDQLPTFFPDLCISESSLTCK